MSEIPGDLRDDYDVAVIGAGPAGLAAASLCARFGLATAVFDEQPAPGGRAYRGITRPPAQARSILGAEYWAGEKIAREFLASGARHAAGTTVRSVSAERELTVASGDRSRTVQATHVVIATGALERPFEIPGGTLAGVTTAGAAQALLQVRGARPEGRTVLAGAGPLLWLVAWQLLNAGAAVEAILDTTSREGRARARADLPSFLFSPYLFGTLRLRREVTRRVRVVRDVVALEAKGEGRLRAVGFSAGHAAAVEIPADALLLHNGLVPDVRLASAAGVKQRWDEDALCFVPEVSAFGGSSVPGIYVAGDAAGVAGPQAAAWRGVMCAADIIHTVDPDAAKKAAKAARAALSHFHRGRRFLDAWYRPAPAFLES